MADLLQSFPSAAIGGIQWHTLIRKYEEKHGAQLDLEVLGHSSALAAATALLWDVIRIVEADDTDNPVVAVEDAIALTPSPGCLASWPSLYQVLCEVVRSSGSLEKTDNADGTSSYFILLSQVKPLLQRHWHSNFDEFGLTYFTEEGSIIRLKKMKHLLQALLRWRTMRVDMASSPSSAKKGASAVDKAVEMELLLVPSKTHNDLILRCVCPAEALTEPAAAPATATDVPQTPQRPRLKIDLPTHKDHESKASVTDTSTTETASDPHSPSCKSSSGFSCASAGSGRLEQELAFLRSENAKLRSTNNMLETRAVYNDVILRAELFPTPSKPHLQFPPPDMVEVFDDPFEPPPEIRMWDCSPVCSTPDSFSLGTLTPFSESSTSRAASGYATPVPLLAGPNGQPCNGVTLVPVNMPVWFQAIPSGVVQHARAMYERHTSIPNWFVQQ